MLMLKFYNTMTRKKEVFEPMHRSQVTLYSCGPTVYDNPHIGNFRSYLFVDILKRYLEYLGYSVRHVMNLTDVDDKTIRGSRRLGIPLDDYTKKYKEAFFDDLRKLKIEPADVYPEATKHIIDMISIIRKLLEKGYAYRGEDGIYYDISKFPSYGKLAHMRIKSLKSGARVRQDEYDKKKASDFALWKFWDSEDGDVYWETDLGRGRPGWHIECSTMSMRYLGETIDIHTGGVDLIFPHHENEIAQSEAATGKKFVRFWMHNEWLLVDGKKMSKSLGNFYTLHDIIEKNFDPIAFRYLVLSAHYRTQMNFTFKSLEKASKTVDKLNDFMLRIKETKGPKAYNEKIHMFIVKTKKEFERCMDDDLNTPKALATIFSLVSFVNKEIDRKSADKKSLREVHDFLRSVDKVLGIFSEEKVELTKEEKKLISERSEARKKGNFKRADEIRAILKQKGIILEDTPEGVRFKKIR